MKTLEATYKIITPIFIFGYKKNEPELRPSSFKGVLRFWYRAVALPKFENSWRKVKDAENKLFGSIETGKAKFSFRMERISSKDVFLKKLGHKYLGYGINSNKCISENAVFKVKIFLNPFIEESEIDLLKKSLIALGLFGGMGTRSRRGFGSLNLISLKYDNNDLWSTPKDLDSLEKIIKDFINNLGQLSNEFPEYSSFTRKTRIFLAGNNNDANKLLNYIGEEMIRYRSYGKWNKEEKYYRILRNEKSEQIFKEDHDLLNNAILGEITQKHPRRVVFGLPHNYYFSSSRINVDVNAKSGRRASPLFIHIHQVGDNFVGIFTMLASIFLPDENPIVISVNKGEKKICISEVEVDYQLIVDFINRISDCREISGGGE